MALFDFLFGSKGKVKQYPTMAPYQQQALENYYRNPLESNPLYQQGSQFLQNLYGGQGDQAFEAPYLQNFQQNIIPQLTEQFAGQGTGAGGLNSSGFQNSLAQAGKNLQVDLAGMRSQRQLQGLPLLMQQAQAPGQYALQGLGATPFSYGLQQPTQGLFGPALGGLAGGIGGGFGLGYGSLLGQSLFGGQQGFGGIGSGNGRVGMGGWGY